MDLETKDKLKAKAAKMAAFFIKNNITKQDIGQLCMDDPEFCNYRDIIGSAINYCEWRVHPNHPTVEVSTEGDVKINGDLITPKIYRGYKVFKYVRGKKTMDVDIPSLVLSAFVPRPTDGQYTVGYRDENPDNTRIQNLYWKKIAK